MGKPCFFTKGNIGNDCQPCRIGNSGALFERYKALCAHDSPKYIGKKGEASVRAIIRKICKIGHDCARNSACDSFIGMLYDDKLNPSALPVVRRFLSRSAVSGFYVSVSIDRMREIFCSQKFRGSMLPFFEGVLRTTDSERMHFAMESISALFANPNFEEAWLTHGNYEIMVKIMHAAYPDPGSGTIPAPFHSFALLLSNRGFSIAMLSDICDKVWNLDSAGMARYFYLSQKDNEPAMERYFLSLEKSGHQDAATAKVL